MENGKQPITPTTYIKIGEGENDYVPLVEGYGNEIKFGGLTKREYFAGLAMQGLLANGSVRISSVQIPRSIAEYSLEYADALLNELNK